MQREDVADGATDANRERQQIVSSTKRPSREPASRWIWPFELKERIGEGGMGVVYRARYVVNNHEVAVKLLPDDVTNPVVLARFERELEVLKNLSHPNIVRSFGGVCEDKHRFYAMELVEGGSLEDQLQQRGRLSWEQVVEYGRQMCAALSYLHQHGVVHRDVKPANFLISQNNQLKLSDFGLASVIAARKITTAGKTAGTILYMAPEQIRGANITPRTDLYALGCVLYELLTGTPPFVGRTPAATMHMHCHDPVPRVTKTALDCPVALEQIIQRLLEKDPQDRPADAVSVARELSRVTQTIEVVPKRRALDSSDFQLASASESETETADVRFKETRAVARNEPRRRWPVIALLVAIAALALSMIRAREAEEFSRQAEALWIESAQDDNTEIRIHALQSLARLPNVSPQAVEAVAAGLSSEDPRVRVAAAMALGRMEAIARPQLGPLRKVWTNDPLENVRAQAGAAVDRIINAPPAPCLGWPAVLSGLVLLAAGAVLLARNRIARLLSTSKTP